MYSLKQFFLPALLSYVLVLLPLSLSAAGERNIATVVDVLKAGRQNTPVLVQGNVEGQIGNSRISINDGTFKINVILTPELQQMGIRKYDILLIEGYVQARFLQANEIVATAVQKLDRFLPVNNHAPKNSRSQKRTRPRTTVRTQPQNEGPLNIAKIHQNLAAGKFVTVEGTIERFIEGDFLVLADSSAKIGLVMQNEHQLLKLKPNERISVRAKVTATENGSKGLSAVFIERVPLPTPAPVVTAPSSATLTTTPPPATKTTPVTQTQPKPKTPAPQVAAAQATPPKATAPQKPKPPAATTERSFEERFALIKKLHDQGIITREEYDTKRKQLLSEL